MRPRSYFSFKRHQKTHRDTIQWLQLDEVLSQPVSFELGEVSDLKAEEEERKTVTVQEQGITRTECSGEAGDKDGRLRNKKEERYIQLRENLRCKAPRTEINMKS